MGLEVSETEPAFRGQLGHDSSVGQCRAFIGHLDARARGRCRFQERVRDILPQDCRPCGPDSEAVGPPGFDPQGLVILFSNERIARAADS